MPSLWSRLIEHIWVMYAILARAVNEATLLFNPMDTVLSRYTPGLHADVLLVKEKKELLPPGVYLYYDYY